MKKVLAVALPLLAVVTLAVASSYSCGNDKASAHETKATSVSSKSACCSSAKTTDAKMTAAQECPYAKAMAAGDMHCDVPAGCTVKAMSIKGMTCTGCEQSVTAALMKVPGVVKVASISYKDEKAIVCIDPTKCKDETCLTKAVADKGYTAEIIPAVAHTVTSTGIDHPSCSQSGKAACGAKTSCSAAQKTAETSKSTKTTDKLAETK